MERIPQVSSRTEEAGLQEQVGSAINVVNHKTKRAMRSLISYGGLVLSMVIVIVFIVAMTTKMHSVPPEDIGAYAGDIIMTWLIYCVCASMTYIASSDSGLRAGKLVPDYGKSMDRYAELRKHVVDKKYQAYASEFCQKLCKEEQISTRTMILSNFGITYDQYVANYEGKDREQLMKEYSNLTKLQIKSICKANAVEQIGLTPEMLMRVGDRAGKREFLGMNPNKKKSLTYVASITRITLVSAVMAFLVVDMILEPTWATFAESIIKALMITVQGFMGYKFGYDHITITCAEYAEAQADLLQNLIYYCEDHDESVYDNYQQEKQRRMDEADRAMDTQ